MIGGRPRLARSHIKRVFDLDMKVSVKTLYSRTTGPAKRLLFERDIDMGVNMTEIAALIVVVATRESDVPVSGAVSIGVGLQVAQSSSLLVI